MKRALAIAVLATTGLVGRDAAAFEFGTPAQEHPSRSPQNFAFELRFSPYRPQIDEEESLNGKTPFADAFGDKPRLYIGAEFDWQIFRIPYVGTIGPGV